MPPQSLEVAEGEAAVVVGLQMLHYALFPSVLHRRVASESSEGEVEVEVAP